MHEVVGGYVGVILIISNVWNSSGISFVKLPDIDTSIRMKTKGSRSR